MSLAARKRQELAKMQRHRQVASLYLAGKRMWQIAEIVGVTLGTVQKDMIEIREQWKAETNTDYETKILDELARLQRVEEKAWEGWEKSFTDQETRTTKTKCYKEKIKGKKDQYKLIPYEEVTDHAVKGQSGNPKFLEQIERCIQLRLKLIGALDPDVTQNVNVIQVNWSDLTKPPEKVAASDPLQEALKSLAESTGPLPLPEPKVEPGVVEYDTNVPVTIESTAHLKGD